MISNKVIYLVCRNIRRAIGHQKGIQEKYPFDHRSLHGYRYDVGSHIPSYKKLSNDIKTIPWNLIGQSKVLNAQGNFIVFVNPNFNGDYLLAYNYTIIPELNAILIL